MQSVLVIAYFFPPIGGAGVQRAVKFARYLPAYGYRPVVVTGPGMTEDRWTPKDTALAQQIPQQGTIYRISSPQPKADSRLRRRLSTWFGIPSSFRKWWVRSVIETGADAIRDLDPRIIFATMSPFESAFAAAALSERFSIPWIADLRDPWALDEMKVFPTALHRKLEEDSMCSALSYASAVVMNTPEATKILLDRFPILANKIIATITNGFDAGDFSRDPARRLDNRFRIVHSGYLHTDLGLDVRRKKTYHRILGGAKNGIDILTRSHYFLVKAIRRWVEENPSLAQEIELVFAGAASSGDTSLTKNDPLNKNIRFTGYLPHDECLELVRTADLLFLPMHNLHAGKRSTIVPGKAYEYMASGRPILAAVPDGDAREYLEKSGTAHLCRPDDEEGMRRILKDVYTCWKSGKTGNSLDYEYVSRFERRVLTKQLAEVFDQVIGNAGRGRKEG